MFKLERLLTQKPKARDTGQVRAGRAEWPAMLEWAAAGRELLRAESLARGLGPTPPAVLPLRVEGTQKLGLAPCGLEEPGRIELRWTAKGKKVRLNLLDVFTELALERVPRGMYMDIPLTTQPDGDAGSVLILHLDEAPLRPQQTGVRRAKEKAEQTRKDKEKAKQGQNPGSAAVSQEG